VISSPFFLVQKIYPARLRLSIYTTFHQHLMGEVLTFTARDLSWVDFDWSANAFFA
jgi:hypothetical protein